MVEVSETARRVLAAGGMGVEEAIAALGLKDDERLTVAMAKRYVQAHNKPSEEGPDQAGPPAGNPEVPQLVDDASGPVEEPEGLRFHADPPPAVREAIVRRIVTAELHPKVLAWRTERDGGELIVRFLTRDGVEQIIPVRS